MFLPRRAICLGFENVFGFHNYPATFTETNTSEAFPVAMSLDDHFVSVFEESPGLTAGKLDWLGTLPGSLQQAAGGICIKRTVAGYRTAAQ